MNEREIFIKALQIDDPCRRSLWIREASAGDDALVLAVERLLCAHSRAADFLEDPASDFSPQPEVSLVPDSSGSVIGPYRLLEKIGEGGSGVVYLAEQLQPVRRRVALKILKAGLDTHQIIARFEAERQALALMDHPNIARVFDGGETAGGRPYFVMEYVKGIPITEYCDTGQLKLRERLTLFMQVCHAVQHAHQKGVVHRDLKPSNLLVCPYDGCPVPKVIDFGLAKAIHQPLTERTLLTSHGLMMGTLQYMSPEQAELNNMDIDTRTDIYSLGVILYELLTGTTPIETQQFKGAAWQEILRLIKEEDPAKPSTKLSAGSSMPQIAAQRGLDSVQLSRAVRGDLDWIVMKSLEKDRSRRYETATSLAHDIDRYLHDLPVEASPPSRLYRFQKFARRNRVLLTTTMLVSAALIGGTTVSTWQAIRATQAEARLKEARDNEAELRRIAEEKQLAADQARAAEVEQHNLAKIARSQAEAQRSTAEANYRKARNAVDEYFTLVSENRLLDVPGLQPLRKELLSNALRFYQDFSAERTDDPTVLANLAVTYLRIAVINHTLDQNDDAIRAIDQALDVIDRLRQQHPVDRRSLRQLAGFWRGFRPTLATTALPKDQQAALRTLNRLAATWSTLAEEDPQKIAFLSDSAALNHSTGDLLFTAGNREGSRVYFERAKDIWERLARDRPDAPEYRADLARANQFLAEIVPSHRRRGVDVACRQALELRESLVAEHPDKPQYQLDLAISLVQYGKRVAMPDPAESERSFRRAIDLTQSLVRKFPAMPVYRLNWYAASLGLGKLLIKEGRHAESESILRPLAEFGDFHSDDQLYSHDWRARVADVHLNLAQLYFGSNRPEEAEQSYRKSVELLGDRPRWFRNLAWEWVALSNYPFVNPRFACGLAQKAVELAPDDGTYLNTLGLAYYRAGLYVEAAETLARSNRLNSAAAGGALPGDIAFLAMTYYQLGKSEEAHRFLEQLQGLVKSDQWSPDTEAEAFLREASTLIVTEVRAPVRAHTPVGP